jgi:hypothetical protein
MKALSKRLRRLEASHTAERSPDGLTKVEVFTHRICHIEAQETRRPFETILAERQAESKAFWASYEGDPLWPAFSGAVSITDDQNTR